jgi:uncharacterized membrane protein
MLVKNSCEFIVTLIVFICFALELLKLVRPFTSRRMKCQGMYHAFERLEMCTKFWLEGLKGRGRLEEYT